MARTLRRLAPLLAAVVVALPLVAHPDDDDFPLSTYPMFSTDRGREASVATAVLDDGGEVQRLSPEAIAGTDEVILAAATVSREVRDGRAADLCAEIADRLGPGPGSVVVRTERIDTVAVVADGADPRSVSEHARCERPTR